MDNINLGFLLLFHQVNQFTREKFILILTTPSHPTKLWQRCSTGRGQSGSADRGQGVALAYGKGVALAGGKGVVLAGGNGVALTGAKGLHWQCRGGKGVVVTD